MISAWLKKSGILMTGIVFWVLVIGLMSVTVLMPAERNRKLQYYFPVVLRSAEGIKVGSRVEVLGVDQGYVNHLRYTTLDSQNRIIRRDESEDRPSANQVVIAVLNMRTEPVLYSNYRIYTRYPAIISDKIIDIRPGNAERGEAREVLLWNSREMLFYRQTGNLPGGNHPVDTLARASNYDDPITVVADVLSDNRGDIRRIIKNIADATEKINNPGGGTLSMILNDAELIDRTNATLRDTIVLLREGHLLAEDLRESQAPVFFLEAYLIEILLLASGAPL
jgi:hypothetical protein